MARTTPYGAFNFIVEFDGNEAFGGFSDVSGLSTELTMAEYRAGNFGNNHVIKVPGVHKTGDVTLKRGIINSKDFSDWIKLARKNQPGTKKDVTIILRDETGTPVQKWKLYSAAPMKYTGPTLAAKGGGDVAMEELVLSAEEMDIENV